MRTAVLLVTLSLTTTALADPAAAPAKPKLSAADQKTYNAQLSKGRQLEAAGKHTDAIAAFEAGLQVAPDDATLLGELGASAIGAKDYKRAEDATRKSIAASASPSILGASEFNLGVIQEAQHNKNGAIASYTESLRVRPNSIVRSRLAKLDPATASLLDPYKPVAMAGPFPSIDAYCKTVPTKMDIYGDGESYDCVCRPLTDHGDSTKSVPAAKLTAPYQQAQLVERVCAVPHTENSVSEYGVAVQLANGWYVAGAVDREQENRHCTLDMSFGGAKVADVAAAPGAEALVDFKLGGDCAGGDREVEWTRVSTVVVGIGASKVPSATPQLTKTKHEVTTTDAYERGAQVQTTGDIALDFAWGKDGTFNVSGKTKGLDATESAKLLGKHALVFP